MMKKLIVLLIVGTVATVLFPEPRKTEKRQAPLAHQPEAPTAGSSRPGLEMELLTPSPRHPVASSPLPEPVAVLAGEAEATETDPTEDQAGVTDVQRMNYLVSEYARFDELGADMTFQDRPSPELGLALRCVATIQHSFGRADFGDSKELSELGGFNLTPSDPDEFLFAADRARFSVMKGEFPVLDHALDRTRNLALGRPVEPLDQDFTDSLQQLYLTALSTLDV